MAESWNNGRIEHWLTNAFSRSFESVLVSIGSKPAARALKLTAVDPQSELWGRWSEPTWLQVSANGIEGGSLRVGCVGDTASAIAAHVGREGDGGPDFLSELVNQTVAGIAGTVGSKLESTVEFERAEAVGPPSNALDAVGFRLEIDGVPHTIALVPSPEFVKVLGALKKPTSEQKATGVNGPQSIGAVVVAGGGLPANLAVLMDVELDLAVSFGSTVMSLEEVQRLSSGAIVELNRGASDPVDLLINDSVIARGEVVVVDGNYGVRVTQIVSPSERIATVL